MAMNPPILMTLITPQMNPTLVIAETKHNEDSAELGTGSPQRRRIQQLINEFVSGVYRLQQCNNLQNMGTIWKTDLPGVPRWSIPPNKNQHLHGKSCHSF